MKIRSAPLFPVNKFANGIPTNFSLNMTPEGQFQAVRVLKPGLPDEGDFEILFEGTQEACEAFIRAQIHKEFPGLLSQVL